MEADDPEAYWRLGDLPKGSTTLKDSAGSSASATKTPSGAGSTLYIGGGELAGGKTLNGTLDEIAYYGSELAAAAGGAAPGGQARACGPRRGRRRATACAGRHTSRQDHRRHGEGRILPHLGHRKLTALSAPELRDWLVETLGVERVLNGKAADTGRGIIADVSAKLVDTFAENLTGKAT